MDVTFVEFNRNELDEFGICFFFTTFIFSCIIIAKYLYSQVIPLCAKRRLKTMILSFYFNRF